MSTDTQSRPTLKCPAKIAAVRELPGEDGFRTGILCQIEAGTLLQICGEGYDERTIKVSSRGEVFYVFRQDLERTCLKK